MCTIVPKVSCWRSAKYPSQGLLFRRPGATGTYLGAWHTHAHSKIYNIHRPLKKGHPLDQDCIHAPITYVRAKYWKTPWPDTSTQAPYGTATITPVAGLSMTFSAIHDRRPVTSSPYFNRVGMHVLIYNVTGRIRRCEPGA